ncbi:MAG: prenyltransferase [Bdellovibrionaceae bacterium]|nr:prenyltransferase [Bdellovibrio sp.]
MSATRFQTIKKSDPLFIQYLWGESQSGARPVPIETFNLGLPEETVTFEFLTRDQISKVNFLTFLSHFIKLNSFTLVLMPLFFVLTKNFVNDRYNDPFSIILAALSMILLYAGLNIRNDVVDHLSGFDRVNIAFYPKPILKGWITAKTASRISWTLMTGSFLISLPIFILQNELIRVVTGVILLIIMSQLVSKNSYKNTLLGEMTLFLLLGPALVAGYQVSMGAGIDTEVLSFGVLWGTASVFLIHINNFSHLVTSAQARIKNSMTNMGFDNAKKFIIFWWFLLLGMWIGFHWFFMPLLNTLLSTLILIGFSVPFLIQLKKIKSPLGSELRHLRKESVKIFVMIAFIFFVENLLSIGTKLNWTY